MWGLVQDSTVGYGYRPWLAGVWLLGLLVVGTAYFAADPPVTGSTAQGRFDPFAYTLDVILPIVSLEQNSAWILSGVQTAVFYALTMSAWVLLTALVAGVSRVLSRT
jgi:hypothetical protein